MMEGRRGRPGHEPPLRKNMRLQGRRRGREGCTSTSNMYVCGRGLSQPAASRADQQRITCTRHAPTRILSREHRTHTHHHHPPTTKARGQLPPTLHALDDRQRYHCTIASGCFRVSGRNQGQVRHEYLESGQARSRRQRLLGIQVPAYFFTPRSRPHPIPQPALACRSRVTRNARRITTAGCCCCSSAVITPQLPAHRPPATL